MKCTHFSYIQEKYIPIYSTVLLCTIYEPGPILGTWETPVNKTFMGIIDIINTGVC